MVRRQGCDWLLKSDRRHRRREEGSIKRENGRSNSAVLTAGGDAQQLVSHLEKMDSLCGRFCPQNIPAAVQRFRDDNELPHFRSKTLTQPLSGGHCQIYRLGFSDNTNWAVRIPIHLSSAPPEAVVSLLATEVKALQQLENCQFPWSPKLIGHDLTFDNPVGFPFLVLTWIPGNPLIWTASTPAKRADRDKVLKQMANIMLSLISCTHRDARKVLTQRVGSALENLTNKIDEKIIRICRGELREIRVMHCFLLQSLLEEAIHRPLDNAPFFIDHGDLSPQNIIVDSEYNITGIIDWGPASYQPFQLAASLPRFLAIEHSVDLALSLMLQKDRSKFLEALTSESPRSPTIVPMLVLMYSAPDVDYRRLVLEATVSKGRHKWFADELWTHSESKKTVDVRREVDDFLARQSGRSSGLAVSDVMKCL
ncbi:hypothetical protein PRK78_005894 [Emydomyces testavorans]|uniref:Aminoglycoside phosphotransferase domain-containing protein n=1 Tax=Emydomyces testavorans TaxID=2070801 RepID=A0AAF0DLD8_9EURO|nr:hypothetical protein PRK78_005894 [Emydomyces testavorans]